MKRVVSVVCIAAAFSTAILAQFAQGDGFSGGPCCSTAVGTLPAFPTVTVGGLGASINNCGLESQFDISATLAPVQVLSDYVLITLTIDAQPAFSITNQLLAAKYARSWIEVSPTGAELQVWRFLVNGDLAYSAVAPAAAGTKIPLSTLPPHNLPAHFIGNVDFAKNLGTGTWEISYTLSHFCPVESHATFSQRPIGDASTWANRTYHFVGPSNFTFDAFPSPSGPIAGESARLSVGIVSGAPYTTFKETGIHRGLVVDNTLDCVGGTGAPTANAPRYHHQALMICNEFCGNEAESIQSVPIGLPTIPTGLRGLGIGKFVPAAGSHYPGEKYVSVYLGVLQSAGVCAAPGSPSMHAVSGVATGGGNPVILFDLPLPFNSWAALDLHDMNVLTPAGFTPGFGSLFGSERVWSFTLL